MYIFKYQKTLLNTFCCLFLKSLKTFSLSYIYSRKIHDQELKSPQYLDYHENILIVLS